jgi:hypothetical protein
MPFSCGGLGQPRRLTQTAFGTTCRRDAGSAGAIGQTDAEHECSEPRLTGTLARKAARASKPPLRRQRRPGRRGGQSRGSRRPGQESPPARHGARPAADARPPAKPLDDAASGGCPARQFLGHTHKPYRKRLDALVALVKAGDAAGLEAVEMLPPRSSSPAALMRYRDVALIALKAQAAK